MDPAPGQKAAIPYAGPGPSFAGWPGRGRIRFVSFAILGFSAALLAASFWTFDGARTAFGPPLGADFAGLYAAGTLLREHDAERLYDFALQDDIYHRVLPGTPPEEKLPYVYPPFFTLLLRPLAALPYPWAYALWLSLSVVLCLGGLALMRRTAGSSPADAWPSILLLAVSFQPMVFECWLGGQTAGFGFFALAAALCCERARRPVLAGLALAACLYKPPLLGLIVPMLLFARRWRILGGFALGGLGLAALALLAVGWGGCVAYVRLMTGFAGLSLGNTPGFPAWKFVDLNSFGKMLLGGAGPVVPVLEVACAGLALVLLVPAWWRLASAGEAYRALVWSGTLTCTLVLNVYVGVYDTVVVILGIVLTADALLQRTPPGGRGLGPTLKVLLVLLYVVPWITQHLARGVGFQPYSVVLAALGIYQLLLARRMLSTARGPGLGLARPSCQADG